MAPSSFSLLLRHHRHHRHRHRALFLLRHLSLSSATPTPPESPKPTSLSARLSFVFDKIDEIEKDRADKDDALHRIRAWRQSKKLNQPPPPPNTADGVENEHKLGLGFSGGDHRDTELAGNVAGEGGRGREIEVAHPWPEWVGLMERLVKQNYFDQRRVDEDKMVQGLGEGIDNNNNNNDNDNDDDVVKKFGEGNGNGVVDFTRDWKSVHMAMINFGKDRFDIFRSLSRQDIQILVGYGCPSADKKVVFSSKLLRKHAHLDEGDVCSTCSLRNTCERAYLITNKEDEARTIDVMRVLFTYGFDPIDGSVENKSLLKQKSVKGVVRKVLHEIVRLSAVPIDPNLPPPLIKKRPPKVKQPPPPPKRRVGRDDIEMKMGDWLCQKCNFMNFAKNTVCLQCDAKRPKRQLLPGEWECPQCDFLNYRRNMTCFNCEHKRPPDGYMDNQTQGRENRPPTRLDRVPNREEVSNAWNFDFDDDESDGADVAAFEYADPHAMNEDRHLDGPPDGNFSRAQEDYRAGRTSSFQENEQSKPAGMKHSMGFDDFDDFDDDIDNYELDNQNRNEKQEASVVRFSDVESEGYSGSESDDELVRSGRRSSSSYPKSSKPLHQRGASSNTGDDDLDYGSDEDLPVHPKWKSSHVADSGLRDRTSRASFKQRIFDSDDDDDEDDDRLVFGNDNYRDKGFGHKQGRGNFRDSDKREFRGMDDNDGDNYRDRGYAHKQGRGDFRDSDKRGFREGRRNYRDSDESDFNRSDDKNRRRGGFRGRPDVKFVNSNDFDGPSRGSGRNQRGSFDNERGRGSGRSQRGSFDNERGLGSGRSQRGSFDNERGLGSGRSQRGSFDDERGLGSGRSQRGSFDNDRGRGSDRSQRESFDNEHGQQRMNGRTRGMQNGNWSRPRGAGGGRRGRSGQSNDWSDGDNDRPVRERRNVR